MKQILFIIILFIFLFRKNIEGLGYRKVEGLSFAEKDIRKMLESKRIKRKKGKICKIEDRPPLIIDNENDIDSRNEDDVVGDVVDDVVDDVEDNININSRMNMGLQNENYRPRRRRRPPPPPPPPMKEYDDTKLLQKMDETNENQKRDIERMMHKITTEMNNLEKEELHKIEQLKHKLDVLHVEFKYAKEKNKTTDKLIDNIFRERRRSYQKPKEKKNYFLLFIILSVLLIIGGIIIYVIMNNEIQTEPISYKDALIKAKYNILKKQMNK